MGFPYIEGKNIFGILHVTQTHKMSEIMFYIPYNWVHPRRAIKKVIIYISVRSVTAVICHHSKIFFFFWSLRHLGKVSLFGASGGPRTINPMASQRVTDHRGKIAWTPEQARPLYTAFPCFVIQSTLPRILPTGWTAKTLSQQQKGSWSSILKLVLSSRSGHM